MLTRVASATASHNTRPVPPPTSVAHPHPCQCMVHSHSSFMPAHESNTTQHNTRPVPPPISIAHNLPCQRMRSLPRNPKVPHSQSSQVQRSLKNAPLVRFSLNSVKRTSNPFSAHYENFKDADRWNPDFHTLEQSNLQVETHNSKPPQLETYSIEFSEI